MKNLSPTKKVLFLALSGIGNYLMQLPTMAAIKKAHPNWHLTVWIAPRGTKELAENDPSIDKIIDLPIKTTLLRHLKNLQLLRANKYNIGIVLSPGQLLKGAAYLYLAGIPIRIGHTYPLGKNPHHQPFLNKAINENESLHDIEQNLALLPLLNIPIPPHTSYALAIPESARRQAEEIWSRMHIPSDRRIIAIHPGSAPGFTWKRWPLENFAAVGKHLIEKHNAHLLIIGGPDEGELKNQLAKLLTTAHRSLFTTNLLTTVAIVKKCSLLLTNDSGLMHLASAAGVPVLALFGPTNEQQTGPRGPHAHVLRAPNTRPIYNTERNPTLGSMPHPSLTALSPEFVINSIDLMIKNV